MKINYRFRRGRASVCPCGAFLVRHARSCSRIDRALLAGWSRSRGESISIEFATSSCTCRYIRVGANVWWVLMCAYNTYPNYRGNKNNGMGWSSIKEPVFANIVSTFIVYRCSGAWWVFTSAGWWVLLDDAWNKGNARVSSLCLSRMLLHNFPNYKKSKSRLSYVASLLSFCIKTFVQALKFSGNLEVKVTFHNVSNVGYRKVLVASVGHKLLYSYACTNVIEPCQSFQKQK